MKRLTIALALILGVAWGKSLPKWAKDCSKGVQIEKTQTKDEKNFSVWDERYIAFRYGL